MVKEAVVRRCSVKKSVVKNLAKFTAKHLCQSLFLDKVAGPRPATLLKKRLSHSSLPVNFAKFLRKPFFIEHLRWLLLGRLFLVIAHQHPSGEFPWDLDFTQIVPIATKTEALFWNYCFCQPNSQWKKCLVGHHYWCCWKTESKCFGNHQSSSPLSVLEKCLK